MSTHFRQNSASNCTKTFSAVLYKPHAGRQMAKLTGEILQTFAANAPKSLVIHRVRNTGYWFYLPAPWSRVLLEKLTVPQLVKKFPAFYGTRRFITAFTSARHLSLFWANSIHSTPLHPTSWRSILILSSHLRPDLPSSLFPSGFPTNALYMPLLSPIRATCPAHLILLDFITRAILGEECRSLSSSLCSQSKSKPCLLILTHIFI